MASSTTSFGRGGRPGHLPSLIDWHPPGTLPKDSDHEVLVHTHTQGVMCGFAESAPDNMSDVADFVVYPAYSGGRERIMPEAVIAWAHLPEATPAPVDAVVLVCDRCGADNIYADATAQWSPERGRYELASTFEQHACNECGADCDAIRKGQVQYRVTMRNGASWLFATDAPEPELIERAQAEWDRRHSGRGGGGKFRFVSTDIHVRSVIREHPDVST